MALALDCEGGQMHRHNLVFLELSQRLRRLAHDVQSLSESQPDFLEKLESFRIELDSLAYQLRRANSI